MILAENSKGFLVEIAVAPSAGAWIEIIPGRYTAQHGGGAPFSGAKMQSEDAKQYWCSGSF